MNLKKDGKGKTKVKVNGSLREQGLKTQMGKKNMALQKKFNAARQGHGSQQQQHRGEGTGRLECWTSGEEHLRRDFCQNQGSRPKIYNAQEGQIVGDVGQSIPHIYVSVDNIQGEHQAFITEMDGKICDQVIYILIDPRSNYSYFSLDLVDKCGLSKELHVESWLVQLATGTKK